MAKKPRVNKTEAVAEYLKAHPKAMSSEIAEALTKEGIKITRSHAANIKSKLKRLRRARRAMARQAAAGAEQVAGATSAPAADGKPAKSGDMITLAQIKKVAQTVNTIGGFEPLHEMLSVIKEVGGLRKFKDLLEAMSLTEPGQIPF